MALNIKANHFDSKVCERGRQYFRSGAVHVQRGDAWSVLATVDGSDRYEVCLTREDGHLKVWCTCPYFDDRLEACKHIWATILAAQAKGYLDGAGKEGALRIEEDPEGLDAHHGGGGRFDESDEYDADFDEDDHDYTDEDGDDSEPSSQSYRPLSVRRPPRRSGWRQVLSELRNADETSEVDADSWTAGQEIHYLVNVDATLSGKGLALAIGWRSKKKDGTWSKLKFQRLEKERIAELTDSADREVLALLEGAQCQDREQWRYSYYYDDRYTSSRYVVPPAMQAVLLPMLCRTRRFRLRKSKQDVEGEPLHWDEGGAWELWLRLAVADSSQKLELRGELRRDGERIDATKPELLLKSGFVFCQDRVSSLCHFGAFDWLTILREHEAISVPLKDQDRLLTELFSFSTLPRLEVPEELRFEEVALVPRPCLKVMAPKQAWQPQPRLVGKLSFDYGGTRVRAEQSGLGLFQREPRRLIRRDQAAEKAAAGFLRQLGFKSDYEDLELAPRQLPQVVRSLLDAGWHVEAEGKIYRKSGSIQIDVETGVDWFDLNGNVRFDGIDVPFPQLLKALLRGENTVRLGDGTVGMLPEDWLKKYGLLARLGKVEGDALRFRRSQVGVLDALLEAQPEVRVDAQFAKARDELRRFAGIEPIDPPEGFVGQLRGYQREALGWFDFLQRFGFGGCLADDMGLGKTVMVLALLESRRQLRARQRRQRAVRPTLAVVPRSLVFNWKQEAARFTPQLRVLDHTGSARSESPEAFANCDLVLTTYGILRRDIHWFKDIDFDYCILDEAQAIKNSGTESAKAARLLQAQHRLVLSGTPVENHLGELWSLFEFLNPGMLGHTAMSLDGGLRNPSAETRAWLARALRPYILRRTKEQVARDLPEKTEQTIYCELEPAQWAMYDELRSYYRQSLLSRVDREGMNRTRIQVLEALLRLRQAACHPGLIDKNKTNEPSAKLELLRAQLAEVVDEGHKALVFSQFTSLLAILRGQLDKDRIPYVYLDGRTRDRQAKVEQFQKDPASKLFLISLKAGGQGLNLTAAEYVFLLDPWWNPAVESQAIDRAHRIGQTRPVFAFRLIARETVEEKVLELQKSKRDLADAIINADNSLIRNLSREDLEMLLS